MNVIVLTTGIVVDQGREILGMAKRMIATKPMSLLEIM
jgi:hypothetical protein